MKTSHLTRNVFRAITANRPYVVRECQRRLATRTRPQVLAPSYKSHQKRSLFGLNFGAEPTTLEGAKSSPANIERALVRLVDLVRARRTHSRLPPDDQVADAFKYFFASKVEAPGRLTRNEAFLATEAFRHLQERGHILSGDEKTGLSEEDLENVLLALATSTGRDRYRSDARILATVVFEALQTRSGAVDDHELPPEAGHQAIKPSLLVTYITVLSKTGSAPDALELLRRSPQSSERTSLPMWTVILTGLANEGRMQDFWKTVQEMRDAVGPLDAAAQQTLVTYLAEHDEFHTLQKVFDLPLEEGQVPTTPSLVKAVDCAMKNGELKWAERLFQLLQERTDSGDMAGTLLLWSALHDPEVKNIQQKLEHMARTGVTDALTMKTINRLVGHAYSQNEAETASRYIQLAADLGLRPDAKTLSLQLHYQLHQGDRTAAYQTYDMLSREDIPNDRCDVPVLNEYIAALSFSANPEYTHLMHVVDYVLDSGADLDAEALAGLCHVFLQKDELEEATGILRHRIDSYPMDDRARVAAVFRQFIVDPTIKDQRAFNAYELFRHAFPEARVEDRILLMQSFFDRGRSDLACLVFGHMRQREDAEARPTPEAYARCFEGIAKCRDIDGLQMVYNMLKLDLEVEQTTRIHNGMMAAYTACQQPFTAIIDHFWKIMESREGPTLSSFALALQACEKWIPQGSHEARHIMALMQSFNLIITKQIYDCYIGALAGQSEFENVVELIEKMEEDIGEPPDVLTIGTFYNAIPWQYRKDEVEKWAKQAYPELWAELESYGDEIDEEWEIRYFKVDRTIDMDDELLFGPGEYHPVIAQASQTTLEAPKNTGTSLPAESTTMSFLRKNSDTHTFSAVFPTYLLPSIPFRRKSRQSSTDSDSSVESTPSSTTSSASSNPFTRCPTPTPIPASSASSAMNPPDDKFLNGHSSHIQCAKCSTDLCLTSQVISKGFTGRHGRAYLVQGTTSHIRTTAPALPNTFQNKAISRNLVTGQHIVSDISCAICGSILGWKYVEASEESQKYKVGKFILETKRIRIGVSWEMEEDPHPEGQAYDEILTLTPRELKKLVDGPGTRGDDLEFDSQDEDECEDLFAGVWSPQLASKRRQRKRERFGRRPPSTSLISFGGASSSVDTLS
ncbi:hypothetical protein LTR41_009051 [Exophiala xenobiotica]|nr:hypothetical protein LTR41_009051 [Exophiala xenobiotica]